MTDTEKPRSRSPKGMIIAGVSLAFLLALLGLAVKGAMDNQQQPVQASNATTVEVTTVQSTRASDVLRYKANLEPDDTAVVTSEISGQVEQILFEDGDYVSAGQTLVVLDGQDFETQLQAAEIDLKKLQIALETSQSAYDQIELNRDRVAALYSAGAVSKQELEKTELELKNAGHSLDMARVNIEAAHVNIQAINASLAKTVVCAPISGEIHDKKVSPGQFIAMGATLGIIDDNSTIKAVIQLKQGDLSRVEVGQTVLLKLASSDTSGYAGEVSHISESANASTRVFDCQVRFDNPEGKLHGGTFGYVEVSDPSPRQVLTVPLAALTGTEGSYSVYTVENGQARKHAVAIGTIWKETAEVDSGLNEGQEIIISDLNTLQDGDSVLVAARGAN